MLIGSDFIIVKAAHDCHCSECGKRIRKGEGCLVSVRMGKVQKRVCSEECRLIFDDAYWQQRARERKRA